ncbi:serine/threonine-protein kinase [Streptomyces sp. S.PB5]|uniref:serine/threonine protein kinase n=1 Tax=Streptomyces sp. S.PB5 TaxID=3020844 RepID=UPI0025B01448|nr:serine/threonine-protein kinase [Streptomyces sp. S.PB5]MDN3024340.1 serine/threonine-protein kinase [Streptomyces sp. S.PB5]
MTMVKAHVSTHELVAGRYRLLEVLHRETNRVSWYGEDVEAGRPCLLTQIGLPADPEGESSRRAIARVIRMSETMGRLCPGRVAPVVDAVEEYGTLWTVTEWIEGTPLGELLEREGTFDQVRAARIGLELLDVLEAGHSQGITHGELSPGQVFVRDRSPLVVTGYGLTGATLTPRVSAPSYASPEQARDERIGPAADLWALGAMLYTMVEGRPPFRDRDSPETTLKGVDRLPLRSPVRAGPLTQIVQGLLRKNSRERLSRQVVREALTRIVAEDPDAVLAAAPRQSRLRGLASGGPGRRKRAMVVGTALAVVTVAVAVVAVARELPGGSDDSAAGAATPGPSATAPPSAPASAPASVSPSASAPAAPPRQAPAPTPTPTPTSASPTIRQPEFQKYVSPQGFSVSLPKGWKPLSTTKQDDLAYRVVLGREGDPRTLAVTFSTRVGDDPVAVWRDDVEPDLKAAGDYVRIGEIRATTYQGREAADLEWLDTVEGTRVHTLGRGFLIGSGRGFSLRWTTPADDWDDAANQQALSTVLHTFRIPSG